MKKKLFKERRDEYTIEIDEVGTGEYKEGALEKITRNMVKEVSKDYEKFKKRKKNK